MSILTNRHAYFFAICVFLFIFMHIITFLCIIQQKNTFLLAFLIQLRYDRWRTAGQEESDCQFADNRNCMIANRA